jgi:hypothetical protein
MQEKHSPPRTPVASRAPRRVNGRLPPGCKTIQVIVPESLFYHVQAQASLSCMDPPDYLYHFLQEAFPLPAPSMQTASGPETAPASGEVTHES